jgi:hypothetical protein
MPAAPERPAPVAPVDPGGDEADDAAAFEPALEPHPTDAATESTIATRVAVRFTLYPGDREVPSLPESSGTAPFSLKKASDA